MSVDVCKFLGCYDCSTPTGLFQTKPRLMKLTPKEGDTYTCPHCKRTFVVHVEEKK